MSACTYVGPHEVFVQVYIYFAGFQIIATLAVKRLQMKWSGKPEG